MRDAARSSRSIAAARRVVLVGIATAIAGATSGACTLEAGHGFGTIEAASLTASLEPGAARDLGDDTMLTDLAYRVQIDRAEIRVDSVALEALSTGSGGGGATFDPAHPPEGYTLCHGGHCHAVDGRLVDYADVMAELAGGGASAFSSVATFEVGAPMDLLGGPTLALAEPSPSRELPMTTITRVSCALSVLSIHGTVTAGPADGGLGPDEVALRLDLPIEGALTTGAEREVDRDHDRTISLSVRVIVDGTLLDGIDFAALTGPSRDAIVIDDPESEPAEQVAGALAASEMDIAF